MLFIDQFKGRIFVKLDFVEIGVKANETHFLWILIASALSEVLGQSSEEIMLLRPSRGALPAEAMILFAKMFLFQSNGLQFEGSFRSDLAQQTETLLDNRLYARWNSFRVFC